MPVHPLIAARFPLIADITDYEQAVDPDIAERLTVYSGPYGPYELPEVTVEARTVAGPHGDIPVRIYRSKAQGQSGTGLLWMHGGGFIAGDLDMPEAHVVSSELAARGLVVVSVDYRLATPERRFPIPLDDVGAAWAWFAAAGHDLGVDPTRRMIGGASAGANLATAATVRMRDDHAPLPAAVLLAYPVVHFPVPALADDVAAEMRGIPQLLRFTAKDVAEITRFYLGRLSDIPPLAMPGLGNLQGLPPIRIVISEYDDLRPSAELFADQLKEAAVLVQSTVAAGMLHGHLNLPPTPNLPEIARSLDFLAGLAGGEDRPQDHGQTGSSDGEVHGTTGPA